MASSVVDPSVVLSFSDHPILSDYDHRYNHSPLYVPVFISIHIIIFTGKRVTIP
jgi:hypothetical protein